jgi:hypothetical protein
MRRFSAACILALTALCGCDSSQPTPVVTATPAPPPPPPPPAMIPPAGPAQPATIQLADGTSVELQEKVLFDGRLALLFPSGFEEMPDEVRAVKYDSKRGPQLVYSFGRGKVDLTFTRTADRMTQRDLPGFPDAFRRMAKVANPAMEITQAEMRNVNGRTCSWIETAAQAQETRYLNTQLGMSVDDRLWLVGWNIVSEEEANWADVGDRILNSVRILR